MQGCWIGKIYPLRKDWISQLFIFHPANATPDNV
jgi:hypothetical protein